MDQVYELYKVLKDNTDFDNEKTGLVAMERFVNAVEDIIKIGDIANIKYVMMSMTDWIFRSDMIYGVGDMIIYFAKMDSVNFVKIFLSNIETMYPHARQGLIYIFIHLLQMDIFKPYVFENFVKLSMKQKRIFKEIYLEVLSRDADLFRIKDVDEALKEIE